MQQAAEFVKCPKCVELFDEGRNCHTFPDGLRNRARDMKCNYQVYDCPVIKLQAPEVTAMNKLAESGRLQGWPFSKIPEVVRICRRTGTDPALAEGYDRYGEVLLLRKGSLPLAYETYSRVQLGQHEQLEVAYWDDGTAKVIMIVDGRPLKEWAQKKQELLAWIVASQGWQRVDFIAGRPAQEAI